MKKILAATIILCAAALFSAVSSALSVKDDGFAWRKAPYQERLELCRTIERTGGAAAEFLAGIIDDYYNSQDQSGLSVTIEKAAETQLDIFLKKEVDMAVNRIERELSPESGRLLLEILFLYSPALVITLIIWFIGRKNARWLKSELPFIFLPLFSWYFLTAYGPRWKSLASLNEVLYCGVTAGFILMPRLFIPAYSGKMKIAITSVSALAAVIVSALIYFFTPHLP